jgi:pimeloyl-ACP methyl ester carboxylesterase
MGVMERVMKRFKTSEGQRLIYESYGRLLEAWGVAVIERDMETIYGRTHVILAGDRANPPLMLFHGTADNSAMMWLYNAKELSRHYYLIAVDAVGGSGKSEPNERYYSQFDQLIWIDGLLDQLQVSRTHIAGVSYGAYLAYFYALNRLERVDKVVCMAGGIAASTFEVMTKMMAAFMPYALFPSRSNCRKLLKKLCGPNYSAFENHSELMDHWYYLLKYFNNRSMLQHKITPTHIEQLQSLRDKTLFLIGQYDRLSYYPKAIARLEQASQNYKIIPNAGHAINHEQPDVIHREITRFMQN